MESNQWNFLADGSASATFYEFSGAVKPKSRYNNGFDLLIFMVNSEGPCVGFTQHAANSICIINDMHDSDFLTADWASNVFQHEASHVYYAKDLYKSEPPEGWYGGGYPWWNEDYETSVMTGDFSSLWDAFDPGYWVSTFTQRYANDWKEQIDINHNTIIAGNDALFD